MATGLEHIVPNGAHADFAPRPAGVGGAKVGNGLGIELYRRPALPGRTRVLEIAVARMGKAGEAIEGFVVHSRRLSLGLPSIAEGEWRVCEGAGAASRKRAESPRESALPPGDTRWTAKQ